MKKIIPIVLLATILSSCSFIIDKKDYPVTIFQGGHTVAYCKSIDAEKRVAYNCFFSGLGTTDAYHLGDNDSWSRAE